MNGLVILVFHLTYLRNKAYSMVAGISRYLLCFYGLLSLTNAGISPVHDHRAKLNSKDGSESIGMNSPHRILNHIDNSIQTATKNVTQNVHMEQNLYQISKDLVSSILSKLEIQDKITRITREALEAPGKNKGISAIETRRILDYISRTLSGHILSITRSSTEPELHRLVYGLGQIAAEVSIVSALQDATYSNALTKKHSTDVLLRKKRETEREPLNQPLPTPVTPSLYNIIMNDTKIRKKTDPTVEKASPFSVLPRRKSVQILKTAPTDNVNPPKGFLNQTVLEAGGDEHVGNVSEIIINKAVNATLYIPKQDEDDLNTHTLEDDWVEGKENLYKPALNSDVWAELELDQPDIDEEKNEKKAKQKLDRLEAKAKKAILYAGDVAYLAAASVVALRRALTASIEVKMSVKFAKNGMSNHQDLMMNLARTAAQQAGKEARSASAKSLACEKVIKLALKYTSQSLGAKLNHVANRIVMDSLSLSTLAKSMAFVSSDIAINSLYQATEVKPAT